MSGLSEGAVCPICEQPLTNPPAKKDLPDGSCFVLVHPECESQELSEAQIRAIKSHHP